MEPQDLTGTYTYRSFHNAPQPVDDFNRLRFAQLEMRLDVSADGALTGRLVFSPEIGMDLEGTCTKKAPLHLVYTGRGPAGSEIADFHYEYDAVVLRTWQHGVDQVLTLAGTVLRASPHGTAPDVAPAGYTASFLAVRRPT
jgi:hypothetical protein